MNIDALKTLIAIAQDGSYATTARRQNVDPSQISRLVTQLEHELGFRIFHRTTRRLTLTESGQTYLDQIVPALDILDMAQSQAADMTSHPKGRLRISASQAYCQKRLIPLLSAFRALYPDITLDIVASDHSDDLAADQIDLAIRHVEFVQSDYVCTKLHPTTYRLVATPSYLNGRLPPTCPEDLQGHDLLGLKLNAVANQWLFRKDDTMMEWPLQSALTLSSPMSLYQAVMSDNGVGLLADWIIRDNLKVGELVALCPDYVVAQTSFETAAWLVYLNRQHLPLKVRVMIDFLKARLGPSHVRPNAKTAQGHN